MRPCQKTVLARRNSKNSLKLLTQLEMKVKKTSSILGITNKGAEEKSRCNFTTV